MEVMIGWADCCSDKHPDMAMYGLRVASQSCLLTHHGQANTHSTDSHEQISSNNNNKITRVNKLGEFGGDYHTPSLEWRSTNKEEINDQIE